MLLGVGLRERGMGEGVERMGQWEIRVRGRSDDDFGRIRESEKCLLLDQTSTLFLNHPRKKKTGHSSQLI